MKYFGVTLTALAAATAMPALASAQSIGLGGNTGVRVGQDVTAAARGSARIGLPDVATTARDATATAQDVVAAAREGVQDLPPPPGAEISADAHAQHHGNSANARAGATLDVDAIESGTAVVNAAGKTLGTVLGVARDTADRPIGLTVQMTNENTITLPLAAVENRNGALVMVDGE